jgi:hypothetical protein
MTAIKVAALAVLAGLFASFAVVANDTPDRFMHGQARKGTPTVDSHFIGETWKCGGETCWAGLVVDVPAPYWHTGP